MRKPNVFVAILLVMSLSGCSVLMVASRDTKRGDLTVIQLGAQRSTVINELGQPDNFFTREDGGYDDRYKLDPDAHSGIAKFFTGFFYFAADFFTLCLTELIFTPVEIAFKDKLVIFHLTYGADQKLATIEKIKP
ncbi:exported protein of unknown function [Nitrospira japonica]|uniref:Lipoprotein n=1 Tax=Nitrospira japonica TaxID=1325564 RepID=A0A1W1I639_9BACT|nr:hypothetical protein [Nitrospira japonica]SLM48477.1 exported protein of unknown function [Nitrospira japonica]